MQVVMASRAGKKSSQTFMQRTFFCRKTPPQVTIEQRISIFHKNFKNQIFQVFLLLFENLATILVIGKNAVATPRRD